MWRLNMGWHDEKLVRIGLVGWKHQWMDLEGTTRCSPSTFCLLPLFDTEYSLELLKHFQNGILLGVLASPVNYTILGKIDWICVSQMCSVLILPHLHLILFNFFCFDKIPIDPDSWDPLSALPSYANTFTPSPMSNAIQAGRLHNKLSTEQLLRRVKPTSLTLSMTPFH